LPRRAAVEIGELCNRFPQDGELEVLHAVALAQDDRPREAVAALDRARKLGIDPARVIGADNVAKIEEMSRPGVVTRFLWAMAYFAGAYGSIIALMALSGVMLGIFTRGGAPPADGGVGAAHDPYAGQSGIKKLYILSLTASLILFYVAIPFVIAGILGATGAMLYGIFMLGRIPVKLVALIAAVGIAMVWAVLKSLFAKPGTGGFGVQKADTDCPRFHDAIREVADKVETRPVDEVYLGPASEICVRQEGRGPFGMFGVKRRVLTVGMANLRYLTVVELKSILAHEYAHFSHRDTFYSRFIHQVTLSVDQALTGMASAAGKLNYINPFFWFFVLYYRAYSLLAAGFSRSQEYLADRVAASLYGKDIFLSALTKVATNGTLFEATAYDNIRKLMAEGKAFTNLYDAFASYRDEQLTDEQRQKMYEEFINQKGSMFASHPTVRERMAAVASFAPAMRPETTPALSLFDQPEELEKELTEYLTGYFYTIRELEAAAAQNAGE
jgi:Zn-dependent protease with chaperone function